MTVGLRSAIKPRVNHLSIDGKETVNFSAGAPSSLLSRYCAKTPAACESLSSEVVGLAKM